MKKRNSNFKMGAENFTKKSNGCLGWAKGKAEKNGSVWLIWYSKDLYFQFVKATIFSKNCPFSNTTNILRRLTEV